MAELDQPVGLAEYNKDWPHVFRTEAQRISSTLDLDYAALEHIGSTAGPDLIAKPTVDVMPGLDILPPSPELVSRLESLGYDFLGEAGVSERYYFRRRGALASINLHVVRLFGAHWKSNIAFRDFLRSSSECAPDAKAVFLAVAYRMRASAPHTR